MLLHLQNSETTGFSEAQAEKVKLVVIRFKEPAVKQMLSHVVSENSDSFEVVMNNAPIATKLKFMSALWLCVLVKPFLSQIYHAYEVYDFQD